MRRPGHLEVDVTRILGALLALGLVCAACGDDDQTADPPDDPAPTSVPATPTEPPATPTAEPTITPTGMPTATPTEPPATPTATPTGTPTATPTTRPDDPEPPTEIDWTDPSVVVDLGGGWSIAKCEGDALFLCVSRDGEHVSALEALFFDTATLPLFDPDASVRRNLRRIAEDFHESFAEDRAGGCGADYGFERIAFTPATVGAQRGGTFGFIGTMADGSPSEMDVHWATVVDDHVLMVVASAFDPGGCLAPDEGGSFETSELAALRSELDRLLADSPLPARPF